jgi:hypothetical protein
MPGIEKAGTVDVVVNASLLIGFVALATLAACVWVAVTGFADDEVFYPFVLAAWLAHFGLDKRAIGPFRFDGTPPSFSAPQGFYLFLRGSQTTRWVT